MIKRKWLLLTVTVFLVFGLMPGVAGASGDLKSRDLPRGEHFTTNWVTEWSKFSGTMYLEDDGSGPVGYWSEGEPMESGDVARAGDGTTVGLFLIEDSYGNSITVQLKYTTTDMASEGYFYSVEGTGLFEGAKVTGTFTGTSDRNSRPHIHFRWLEGEIAYPNEILIPQYGLFNTKWVQGDTFKILDNDATDGLLVVQFPTGMDQWHIFRQIRGKPGGSIEIHWADLEHRDTGSPSWYDWGIYNLSMFGDGKERPVTNNGVTCVSIRWYPNQ